MKSEKKPKQENPLVLNAEVVGGNWRHRKLGRIVRVTKSLLHVRWDTGTTELFGRAGQAFHGGVGEDGEPLPWRGDEKDDRWGEKDEAEIEIATDIAKTRIADERAAKTKRAEDR